MATHLLKNVKTPDRQRERANSREVENSAGGYVYEVDKWNRLARFLVIGTEGGSYYIGERNQTKENTAGLESCRREDYRRTVNTIVDISAKGRAAKNDYALFALAVVVAKGGDEAKAYALEALPKVARIGTHLFMFVSFLDAFGT